VSQVAAVFVNAPYLNDLLAVLQHPASALPPDLRHFRAVDAVLLDQPGRQAHRYLAPALPAPTPEVLSWAMFGLGVGGCAVVGFLWGGRRRRYNAVGALGLLLLPAALSGSLGEPGAPSPPAWLQLAPASATVQTPRSGVTASAPVAWIRLLSIEQAVASNQEQLLAQEHRIGREVDAATAEDRYRSPFRLPLLLDRHRATQDALANSLKQEYDFYRTVAQNPQDRDSLLTAASSAPEPVTLDAVNYNLGLIQTQLTQEAAIQAAEAKLAAMGSLSAAQLGALQQHQAFIVPVAAPMVQGFGPTDFSLEPPLSYGGNFYPHFHTGVDLAAPLDTPIHAAADGVVLLATATTDSSGHLVGYGNYVVIGHPDGFVTLYGHLNSAAVHEGQVVHQGEIIGQEGSTGLSTGPHLHFEIRHNGEFVDPAPYLPGQLVLA
jgi:murein DD-endopeptidase MepM/ murein hydrolase activator NlpD